jgi:hypothetical protein
VAKTVALGNICYKLNTRVKRSVAYRPFTTDLRVRVLDGYRALVRWPVGIGPSHAILVHIPCDFAIYADAIVG